jgi:hypothetical protein
MKTGSRACGMCVTSYYFYSDIPSSANQLLVVLALMNILNMH